MQLPVELGRAFTLRNIESSTVTKHRLVGYGTPTAANRTPFVALNTAGVDKIAGVIQDDVPAGEAASVYSDDGDVVVIESDGSATIDYGDEVIAVAGASIAASGRVKARGTPSTGANVRVVGHCVSPTQIPATAGAKVLVRLRIGSFQGA